MWVLSVFFLHLVQQHLSLRVENVSDSSTPFKLVILFFSRALRSCDSELSLSLVRGKEESLKKKKKKERDAINRETDEHACTRINRKRGEKIRYENTNYTKIYPIPPGTVGLRFCRKFRTRKA